MVDGNGSSGPKNVFLVAGLLYCVSLGIRLTFLPQAIQIPSLRFPSVDERINWEMAKWALDHWGASMPYFRPPGYIWALAGMMCVVGRDPFVLRVVHVFLDALAPVLVLLIAWRCFGRTVGILAGAVASLYWMCVFFCCQLLDTSLTCLLGLALAYLLTRLPSHAWWKWLICGLVLGLSTLIRPSLLPLAPVLALGPVLRVWLERRAHRTGTPPDWRPAGMSYLRALPRGGLLTLGWMVVIGSCLARNRIVSGEWTLVSIGGGANFWMANNPEADGKQPAFLLDDLPPPSRAKASLKPWEWDLSFQLGSHCAMKKLGEHSRHGKWDNLYYGMALDYIARTPAQFAEFAGMMFRRLCWTFNRYEFGNNRDPYHCLDFSPLLRKLSYLHWGLLAPLALLGIGLAYRQTIRRPDDLLYVLLLVTFLVLFGTLFSVNARYRMPIVCLSLPFASWAVWRLWEMVRHARAGPLAVSVASLGILAVLCNVNLFGYRPDHRPAHWAWISAAACMEVGDTDLLPDAMATLGREMAHDAERGTQPHSTAAMLRRYQGPFRCLMEYHLRRGNWAEALRFGEYMVRYEPFDEVRTVVVIQKSLPLRWAYEFLDRIRPAIRTGDPNTLKKLEAAAEANAQREFYDAVSGMMYDHKQGVLLETFRRLKPVLMKHNPCLLGEFYLNAGAGLGARPFVSMAVDLFQALATRAPWEARYVEHLNRARKALAELPVDSRPTDTAPVGAHPTGSPVPSIEAFRTGARPVRPSAGARSR